MFIFHRKPVGFRDSPLRKMDRSDVIQMNIGARSVRGCELDQIVGDGFQQSAFSRLLSQIQNNEFVFEFLKLSVECAGKRGCRRVEGKTIRPECIRKLPVVVRGKNFQMPHRDAERAVQRRVEDEEVGHDAGDVAVNRSVSRDVQLREYAFGVQQHLAMG